MIDAGGGLHPQVALMLDVESGGNPAGDESSWINDLYWNLGDYAGSPARIIGYANSFDFSNMWRVRPDGLRVIAAGYGANPMAVPSSGERSLGRPLRDGRNDARRGWLGSRTGFPRRSAIVARRISVSGQRLWLAVR
jgi:hypothetical protein